MTNEEAIERWGKYIVPAVMRAEDALQRTRPEWKELLRNVTDENAPELAERYCREIAEIIVRFGSDYEKDESWEEPEDFGLNELEKYYHYEGKGDFS